jgi:hypothetical protein
MSAHFPRDNPMNSSPPGARDSIPPALPRLAEAGFRAHARDEGVIFFCVEAAPREACRTHAGPDGSLSFQTQLFGIVTEIAPGELWLAMGERRVLVRHLLPSAIDLGELCGHRIEIQIQQSYRGRGRATIEAQIRDASGRLLVWAHDGRMPSDRDSHGLALRLTLDSDGDPRLAIGHSGGVASLAVPDLVGVKTGSDSYDFVVVRLGTDDVSFVLLRR